MDIKLSFIIVSNRSGLEEPPRTELDIALDEAIQLEDDSKAAQKGKQEGQKEKKKVQASAAEKIHRAAFTGRGLKAGKTACQKGGRG